MNTFILETGFKKNYFAWITTKYQKINIYCNIAAPDPDFKSENWFYSLKIDAKNCIIAIFQMIKFITYAMTYKS